MGSKHKTLLPRVVVSRKSICATELQAKSAFPDKLWLFILGYLADIFSFLKNERSLSFEGEQLTVFVANDNFEL